MRKPAIAIDAAALVLYLLAANPAITGIPVHEWIGLGVLLALFIHCAMHFEWFAQSLRTMRKNPLSMQTARMLLLLAAGLSLVVCCLSGLLVSGTVLAAFGLYAPGYWLWKPLHAFSAKLLLAFTIVHIATHARQVAALVRKLRR